MIACAMADSAQLSYRHIDVQVDLPELEQFKEQNGEAVPGKLYLITADKPSYQIPLTRALSRTLNAISPAASSPAG